MPESYYNEIDPKAAAWLRELIKQGHIAKGVVDERDVRDVHPDDLRGFTQCHFFAGIGIWSHALRLAGWPDERPVWTGSCPCQPFSSAGRKRGTADERHLWPSWAWLIRQRNPGVIFGEQVASNDGIAWFDDVSAHLESFGYACGPVVLPAAGFGAPHARQRLFFVADSPSFGQHGRGASKASKGSAKSQRPRDAFGMANANGGNARDGKQQRGREQRFIAEDGGAGLMGNTNRERGRRDTGSILETEGRFEVRQEPHGTQPPGPVNGFWADADWIYCTDQKWRPVEPGTFPLAHGATARMGRLRGYGNGIVAPQAAEFIKAYIETRGLK